ncbi:hypothetical protein LOD99_6587 [Oopsacas minuta]|uniref:E3 SUMO-protein ligase NSE2 n=1 Tax=Oopsacas minuta TaxID=111878 RepID=A0AAV7JLG1_9METZ|nr:hypothetical protein LOD99_6587 [Oopsacas minuta]
MNTSIGPLNTNSYGSGSKVQLDSLTTLDTTLTNLQDTIDAGAELCLELAGEVKHSRRRKSHLEQLSSTTESLATVDSEIILMKEALSFVIESIPNTESTSKSVDLARMYQNKFDEVNSTDLDLTNHKYIHSFRQHLLGEQGGAPERLEGDLLLSQVQVSTICPLTQQQLRSPMKNTRCGHVYSRQAILAHIRAKKGGAQCPASGCAAGVVIDELSADREMENRMKRESRVRKSTAENVMVYNKK